MAVEENSPRAELRGRSQRHRGMNAETARFVTRRGDDAALVALASDDDGKPLQLGAREEFNRHEEGVHINVKDRGGRIDRGGLRRIVFRSKVCQLRHGPQYSARARQISKFKPVDYFGASED